MPKITISDIVASFSKPHFTDTPLVAAALAHLTAIAIGPLFIAPLFVVALQMSFGARAAGLAPLQRGRGLPG